MSETSTLIEKLALDKDAINESFNGRSLTSASWWDSRGEQFTDFEDSAVAAWTYMPRPYKKEIL